MIKHRRLIATLGCLAAAGGASILSFAPPKLTRATGTVYAVCR